jgi:heme a synthase
MINTNTLTNENIKAVIDRDDKSQLLSVSKWLNILAVTVIFMMFVGALTRLTGSGLSIPEWPLINGSLMYPSSETVWNEVFEIYKQYPQYHIVNKSMSLAEFKVIFFYEYFHRSLTSLVSLFLLISAFFVFKNKKIRKEYKSNIFVMFALLIIQALAGMYMVNSGLEEGMANVSQYRLAIHLVLALIFLSVIVRTSFDIKLKTTKKLSTNFIEGVSKLLLGFCSLLFLQFISGAFVSGTKAGFHFNDWPLMNGSIVPKNLIATEGRYASNILLNFTENIATVQFMHRLLAYIITAYAIWLFFKLKKEKITSFQEKISNTLLVLLSIQIILGISTLIFHVPIVLAAFHQLGAILLFLTSLALLRTFKRNYEKL